MDLEAKKKMLAEMRAAREAKMEQMKLHSQQPSQPQPASPSKPIHSAPLSSSTVAPNIPALRPSTTSQSGTPKSTTTGGGMEVGTQLAAASKANSSPMKASVPSKSIPTTTSSTTTSIPTNPKPNPLPVSRLGDHLFGEDPEVGAAATVPSSAEVKSKPSVSKGVSHVNPSTVGLPPKAAAAEIATATATAAAVVDSQQQMPSSSSSSSSPSSIARSLPSHEKTGERPAALLSGNETRESSSKVALGVDGVNRGGGVPPYIPKLQIPVAEEGNTNTGGDVLGESDTLESDEQTVHVDAGNRKSHSDSICAAAALSSALSQRGPRQSSTVLTMNTPRNMPSTLSRNDALLSTPLNVPRGAMTSRGPSQVWTFTDRTENVSVLRTLQTPSFLQFLDKATTSVKRTIVNGEDPFSSTQEGAAGDGVNADGSEALPSGTKNNRNRSSVAHSTAAAAAAAAAASAGNTTGGAAAVLAKRRVCVSAPEMSSDRPVLSVAMSSANSAYIAASFSRHCRENSSDLWNNMNELGNLWELDEWTCQKSSVTPGLVLAWNTRRNGKPQRFIYEREIRCLAFSPFHEYIVFGGADNGRVVAWNLLQGEEPVAVSFPSPEAHQTPIMYLAVHGDANNHGLVTVSSDGRVCTWLVGNLRRPSSSRVAKYGGVPMGCVVASTAVVDNNTDVVSKVFFGSIDGILLQGTNKSSNVLEVKAVVSTQPQSSSEIPYGSAVGSGVASSSTLRGSSAPFASSSSPHTGHTPPPMESPTARLVGGRPFGAMERVAHTGPIIAVAAHPPHADPRVSELVLTAGLDGVCRLWLGTQSVVIDERSGGGGGSAILDVQWSPTHPAVFAAAEDNGSVSLWNFMSPTGTAAAAINSTGARRACLASVFLKGPGENAFLTGEKRATDDHHMSVLSSGDPFGTQAIAAPSPVIKVAFSSDGRQVIAGNAAGQLYVLDLNEQLVLAKTATTTAVGTNWIASFLS